MSSTKRKSISDDLTASAKKKRGSRGFGAVRELVEDEFKGDGIAFLKHLEEHSNMSANNYMSIFDEKYKKGWQHLNQIKRQLRGDDISVLGVEWKELVSEYKKTKDQKKGAPSKRSIDKSKAVTPERANKKVKQGDTYTGAATDSARKKAPGSARKTSARKKALQEEEEEEIDVLDASRLAEARETIAEPPSVKREVSEGGEKEKLIGGDDGDDKVDGEVHKENDEPQEVPQGEVAKATNQGSSLTSSSPCETQLKGGFFSQRPWLVVMAGYIALLLVGYGIVYYSARPGQDPISSTVDSTSAYIAPSSAESMGEEGYRLPDDAELPK